MKKSGRVKMLKPSPLITIGLPTFERESSLEKCLERLAETLSDYGDEVELVISDNASSDGSLEVIESFAERFGGNFQIKVIRQDTNVGASKNLLATMRASNGTYFMFIGDDDFLHRTEFGRILELLRTNSFVAVMQTRWPKWNLVGQSSVGSGYDALPFLYFAGNSWATVSLAEPIREMLSDPSILAELSEIVWPQVFLIFASIFRNKKPVRFVNFEIGSQINGWLTSPDVPYMVRTIGDLCKAAEMLTTSSQVQRHKVLTGPTAEVVKGQVRGLLFIAIRDKRPVGWGLYRVLISSPAQLGISHYAMLVLGNFPRVAEICGLLSSLIRSGPAGARHYRENLSGHREAHKRAVEASERNTTNVF